MLGFAFTLGNGAHSNVMSCLLFAGDMLNRPDGWKMCVFML